MLLGPAAQGQTWPAMDKNIAPGVYSPSPVSNMYTSCSLKTHLVPSKTKDEHSETTNDYCVADLNLRPDRNKITFHDLRECSATRDNIQGFVHSFNVTVSTVESCHDKALRKNNLLMAKLATFFDGQGSVAKHDAQISWDSNGTFVGGPPCEGHARNLEGVSAFQLVDFSFLQQNNALLTSRQLLHFSCPTLKVGEKLFEATSHRPYGSVSIVSGVCLFNSNIMQRSCNAEGKIDLEHLRGACPSIYEMEYIARASTAIADLAAVIVARGKGAVPIKITLDVPSFHYYQMIDEHVTGKNCTLQEGRQWIQAVKRRSEIIGSVFMKATIHELSLRMSENALELLVVQLSSPTDLIVWNALCTSFEQDKAPALDDLMRSLERDQVWQRFLSLLKEKERPQNFRDLAHSFYVFQCIRPSLEGATDKTASRRLLLSVDDGAERRIYSQSQKLLKKAGKNAAVDPGFVDTQLMEVYMSRRVFINANAQGSNLYLDDPTPERIYAMDDRSGSPHNFDQAITPYELVSSLYGLTRAQQLQQWFRETGMENVGR